MSKFIAPSATLALAALVVAHAAEAGRVTLSGAQMRSAELAKDADPIAWAERNGVELLERVPVGGGGSIVRFEMEEGVWRARSSALCTDNGVLSCGTDFCQSFFVPVEDEAQRPAPGAEPLAPGAQGPGTDADQDSEGRLELRLVEDAEKEPSGVEGEVVGEDGAALAGARVLLVPRAPAVESLFGGAAPGAADPTQVAGERSCSQVAPPGKKSFFTALTSAKGAFAFADQGMDRGCWELVTAAACQTRVQPLSDLLPEREPQRLLVLAKLPQKGGAPDAALIGRLSQLSGMRVLETSVLASIGKALVRVQLDDATLDPTAALATLRAESGVDAAQVEYRYRTSAQFNDPYAWMNYGARLTGADRLQPAASGAGVRVAVIDSGVDAQHPELAARIAESIDVTGYGVSADRHGTAVAGLIAAEADNELGAFGMAPAATLVAIKACEPESRHAAGARCWSSTIAKAIDAALARDVAIINLSLGGPRDPLVGELIDAALARSRLVVAAAGNGGPDATPSFPASHPGVIAVTAIDARSRLYSQATRGSFVDLAAPGVEVPVPVPGSNYPGQLSGTSMAAAHVSGIAAQLLSAAPGTDPVALRTALESSAVRLQSAADATSFGHGRIDACAAALALGRPPESCAAAPASPAQPAESAPTSPAAREDTSQLTTGASR